MAGSELIQLLSEINEQPNLLLQKQRLIHDLCFQITLSNETITDSSIEKSIKTLETIIPQSKTDRIALTSIHLLIMCFMAVQKGRLFAFKILIHTFTKPEFEIMDPTLTYSMLQQVGWLKNFELRDLNDAFQHASPYNQKDERHAGFNATRILKLLGLGQSKDMDWLKEVLDIVAIPWIKESLDRNYFNVALSIEHMLYNGWLKNRETMDHYQDSYSLWADMFEQAGLRKRKSLPPLRIKKQAKPLIGIFIHNVSWLAHVQTLYQSFVANKERDYDVRLYFLEGVNETVKSRFRDINISCCFIEEKTSSKGFYERFLALRTQCMHDNVEIILWLCYNIFMGFAFGIGLAPKQIYWSMKHPTGAFKLPDDNWVSWNGPDEEISIYNINWKTIPSCYPATSKPENVSISSIRNKYPADAIILGTIGREDKLNSAEFLSTIADILDTHPETIYLYTGHTNLPSISNYFYERRLKDRVDFIGWIEPRLYAELFDIYVDSWPARSGMTAFNALEAAKPYVFCVGDTGNHHLIATHYFGISLFNDKGTWRIPEKSLDQIFDRDGERCLLCVNNQQEYIKITSRLIQDTYFRKLCGQASKDFSHYLTDADRPAKVINKLILENLAQEKKRKSA